VGRHARKHARPEVRPRHRVALAVLGVFIVLTGVLSILSGQLEYRYLFHAPVFAGSAIVGGLVVIFAAIKMR
jgi:hypothetical protein